MTTGRRVSVAIQLKRRRFTVDEYHRMAEVGLLTEDDRVELIDGEIVEMPPIGDRHAGTVDRIATLFFSRLRSRAQVRVQGPVRLDGTSEPQPDLSLLRSNPDFYTHGHPRPDDVLLVIEVADSTAPADRAVKLPLYARAGIREAWLMDLAKGSVEVCRSPASAGYQEVRTFRRGDRLSPQAFPDIDLPVDEMLGPPARRE